MTTKGVPPLVSLCAVLLLARPSAAADWADRGEYDLVLNIRAEASPQKKLPLLDEWKAKYPKSGLLTVRQQLYLSTYESLGDGARMLEVSGELIAADPDNLAGLYWTAVLLPEAASPSAGLLDTGGKAAQHLLDISAARFAAPQPTSMPARDVELEKKGSEFFAHRALGWVQWQRGDLAAAETEFTRCLEMQPGFAGVSAWLGVVQALQKQPEKQASALWHLARAATLHNTDGALSEGQRRSIDSLFEQLYPSYRGAPDGLDEFRAQAASAAFPPAPLAAQTAALIRINQQEQEIGRADPDMGSWLRIRKRLAAPDGEKYLAELLRGNPLPKLRATLVKSTPPKKPEELVVTLLDPQSTPFVIKLKEPLPNDADPGTIFAFQGTAESLTREPLGLAVSVDPGGIEGWPIRAKVHK